MTLTRYLLIQTIGGLEDHLKVAGSSPASGSIPVSLVRECSFFAVVVGDVWLWCCWRCGYVGWHVQTFNTDFKVAGMSKF